MSPKASAKRNGKAGDRHEFATNRANSGKAGTGTNFLQIAEIQASPRFSEPVPVLPDRRHSEFSAEQAPNKTDARDAVRSCQGLQGFTHAGRTRRRSSRASRRRVYPSRRPRQFRPAKARRRAPG